MKLSSAKSCSFIFYSRFDVNPILCPGSDPFIAKEEKGGEAPQPPPIS